MGRVATAPVQRVLPDHLPRIRRCINLVFVDGVEGDALEGFDEVDRERIRACTGRVESINLPRLVAGARRLRFAVVIRSDQPARE